MRQQSKLNVRSVWQLCSQTHQSWKATAGPALRISRREMRNSAKMMIAKGLTRPTSLVGFEKKPKELILEGDCKAVEVAATTRI